MNKLKTIIITGMFLMLSALTIPAQQKRITRIYQPCPNSSTQAQIRIENGDIRFIVCAGKKLYLNNIELDTTGNVVTAGFKAAAAQLNTTVIKPTCNEANRGTLYVTQGSGSGVRQVETLSPSGTNTGAIGTHYTITVTAAGLTGSPRTYSIYKTDDYAGKTETGEIKKQLAADPYITDLFDLGRSKTVVQLIRRTTAANDATLNIALSVDDATGINATPNSTNTTAGVFGSEDIFEICAKRDTGELVWRGTTFSN